MILCKVDGLDCRKALESPATYMDTDTCPLARAINRRLKKGYTVNVGAVGTYTIRAVGGAQVAAGQAKNFSYGVVCKYGEKARSFMRKLDIPAKYVKRTRYKEAVSI